MKSFLFIIFLAFISCKEITYKTPQPKGKKIISEMPLSLQGRYRIEDESSTQKDTLYITANGYRTQGGAVDEGVLGDSLILKKYKGYYLLNINQKPEWALRVIRQEKNGDLLFMSMEDKDFNSFLKKLGSEIKIDSSYVQDEKLYQIDPNPKQLVGLIKKKYFAQVTRIKKLR